MNYKGILLFGLLTVGWILPGHCGVKTYYEITSGGNLCPFAGFTLSVKISEDSVTSFKSHNGHAFSISVTNGVFDLSAVPTITFNLMKNVTSTSLNSTMSDSLKYTFSVSISNIDELDSLIIKNLKIIPKGSGTITITVDGEGSLFPSTPIHTKDYTITSPEFNLSLANGSKFLCNKSYAVFDVRDTKTTCQDYKLELHGKCKTGKDSLLKRASKAGPISFSSNIDDQFSEIYAVATYGENNDKQYGTESNHLILGDATKGFILNMPTSKFKFIAPQDTIVNLMDGPIAMNKLMEASLEWQSVYKNGVYTDFVNANEDYPYPYPYWNTYAPDTSKFMEGNFLFGISGSGIVHSPNSFQVGCSFWINSLHYSYIPWGLAYDFNKTTFDPSIVQSNSDTVKIFATKRQFFENIMGFCTVIDSLSIVISPELINIRTTQCASDTAMKRIQVSTRFNNDMPQNSKFDRCVLINKGKVTKLIPVNTPKAGDPYYYDIYLKDYPLDSSSTKKVLILKSYLTYKDSVYTATGIKTVFTDTIAYYTKIINIFGPPTDVKFLNWADTVCPSIDSIRLSSNYIINSIIGDGIMPVFNKEGTDYYFHPSDKLVNNKKNYISLNYQHDYVCNDIYRDSVFVEPGYDTDTTGYFKDFELSYCRLSKDDAIELNPSFAINTISTEPVNSKIIWHDPKLGKWKFNRAGIDYHHMNKDTVLSISYQYFDQKGCPFNKKIPVIVYDTIRPSFTYSHICNENHINFKNTSTVIGSVSKLQSVAWDFGDLTVTPNTDSVVHTYPKPGKYIVKMVVTSTTGCSSLKKDSVAYGDSTTIRYSVINHLAQPADVSFNPVFYNRTTDGVYNHVKTFDWDFGDGLNEQKTDTIHFTHLYNAPGLYHVSLKAIMNNGCIQADTIPVAIFPYVAVSNAHPALYDFNDGSQNWIPSGDFGRGQNSSWKCALLTDTLADSLHLATDMGWRTGAKDDIQQISWVESPCFNLDNLQYPLLTMDIFESIEKGLDGAAIQYTCDDGQTWNNLGNQGEGLSWYDCDIIQSKPASQGDLPLNGDVSFGWSKDTTRWQRARYPLEEIIKKAQTSKFPCVRFRVRYTSNGSTPPHSDLKGFVFNNFDLTWRKKTILLEQFTNTVFDSNREKEETAWLDTMLDAYKDGACAISYHPWIDNKVDSLFGINPADISSRAAEYDILYRPKTILDGYYESEPPSRDAIIHYAAIHSLEDPGFDIHDVNLKLDNGSLLISADITKLKQQLAPLKESTDGAHYTQDCLVRMAIVQKSMLVNTVDYNNVLIELLPNGEGNSVARIPESLAVSGTVKVSESWIPRVTTVGNKFRLIVYVQGMTGFALVQQVWYKDIPDDLVPQVTVAGVKKVANLKSSDQVMVYPTPVSDLLYVQFDNNAPTETQWQMVNLAGKTVLNGQLVSETKLLNIDVSSLTQGIYLLKMINSVTGQVNTYKVLVQKGR